MSSMILAEQKLYAAGLLRPDAVLNIRDGRRALMRGLQRLFGAALWFATLGIWLFHATHGDPAEALSKIMVSLIMMFCGAALWQAGAPVSKPELEIDLVRREIRLVRLGEARKLLVEKRRFRDLWRAEFSGQSVRIWDMDGGLLVELTMANKKSLGRLRRVLQVEGVKV